jgi:hypothetical protein
MITSFSSGQLLLLLFRDFTSEDSTYQVQLPVQAPGSISEIDAVLYGAVRNMGEVVEEHRGTECRFMGDGLMAMFGVPTAAATQGVVDGLVLGPERVFLNDPLDLNQPASLAGEFESMDPECRRRGRREIFRALVARLSRR